ncbi:MAG: hypothetical protein ACYCPE_03535 [Metallibacterium sp.]
MSLNLFAHAIVAVLWVWFLAYAAWKRVLKNWQPERRLIRYIVSGFLMVTLAGVGWVDVFGPTPLKPFLVANGLFALAFMLGLWARRTHSPIA